MSKKPSLMSAAPIETVVTSERALKALRLADITTVGQLVALTHSDLCRLQNIGPALAADINDDLDEVDDIVWPADTPEAKDSLADLNARVEKVGAVLIQQLLDMNPDYIDTKPKGQHFSDQVSSGASADTKRKVNELIAGRVVGGLDRRNHKPGGRRYDDKSEFGKIADGITRKPSPTVNALIISLAQAEERNKLLESQLYGAKQAVNDARSTAADLSRKLENIRAQTD